MKNDNNNNNEKDRPCSPASLSFLLLPSFPKREPKAPIFYQKKPILVRWEGSITLILIKQSTLPTFLPFETLHCNCREKIIIFEEKKNENGNRRRHKLLLLFLNLFIYLFIPDRKQQGVRVP